MIRSCHATSPPADEPNDLDHHGTRHHVRRRRVRLGGRPRRSSRSTASAVTSAGSRRWPRWVTRIDVRAGVAGLRRPGGEDLLEDMLDFALHGADVVVALGLDRPHLYGHSFGGMIAAEMAALSPGSYGAVGLVAPMGLWLDDHPIPDVYAMLPFDFPVHLFHDPATASVLTGGVDFEDPAAVTEFLVANSRRLGTAGKVLFPIPNRRLAKRLYRVTNPVGHRVGGQRPADPAGLRRAVGRAAAAGGRHDGRRGRAHGAV